MVKFCILYFVLFNPYFGVLFDRTGGCTSTEIFLFHPKALAEAEEGSKGRLRRHTVVAVGRRYLDALLREGAFLEAGQLCVRIFGVNKDLWQEEVFKFARLDILTMILFVISSPLKGQVERWAAMP